MAVTITLDDHVAKSVERALEVAYAYVPAFAREITVALDVLAPAIVEAEGRAARQAALVAFVADPHAPNAHDALEDGWGNDGE